MAVILEDQIQIFDIAKMKSLHVIHTPPNPHGLASLSPSPESPYLVYPANASPNSSPNPNSQSAVGGKIHIFDSENLQDISIVNAHKMPICALCMSYDGKRMATASEKVPFLY